jgi:hypothetical protein
MKLQLLQNRVLRTIGNSIPYVYDYMTKLSKIEAEVVLNNEKANVRNIGQGEARHRKYKKLKLGGGQADDRSSD